MKSGYQSRCKLCNASESKRYYKEAKEKGILIPNSGNLKRLGCSLNEYRECMSTSQVCEVCGSTSKLCYDHDHTTGEFRGVLCGKCNSGIGLLGDTEQGVQQALNYLTGR